MAIRTDEYEGAVSRPVNIGKMTFRINDVIRLDKFPYDMQCPYLKLCDDDHSRRPEADKCEVRSTHEIEQTTLTINVSSFTASGTRSPARSEAFGSRSSRARVEPRYVRLNCIELASASSLHRGGSASPSARLLVQGTCSTIRASLSV